MISEWMYRNLAVQGYRLSAGEAARLKGGLRFPTALCRRHAFKIGTAWLLAVGTLFAVGMDGVALGLGIALVGACSLVTATNFEHGPRVPCVEATMHLYPIDGACHRVASDATAFAYRDARFACVIAGMWPDRADNERNTAWVRDYWEAVHPHSEAGGYVNFMASDDQDRIRDNYRGNYDRLAELKRRYDPQNLFRMNQNIEPAG